MYQTLMIYAAGAHPGMAAAYRIDHPYNAFATRYSSILWHKGIRNVWNPNGLVIVPSSVWWENYVRTLERTAGSDSPLIFDLRRLLEELTGASRSIRSFADYLDRHPEALIRGRQGSYS